MFAHLRYFLVQSANDSFEWGLCRQSILCKNNNLIVVHLDYKAANSYVLYYILLWFFYFLFTPPPLHFSHFFIFIHFCFLKFLIQSFFRLLQEFLKWGIIIFRYITQASWWLNSQSFIQFRGKLFSFHFNSYKLILTNPPFALLINFFHSVICVFWIKVIPDGCELNPCIWLCWKVTYFLSMKEMDKLHKSE